MHLTGTIRALFHRSAPASAAAGGWAAVSPFVTEFVMVECPHYTGLAYQDAEQKWRTAYTDTQLPPPVKVLE